MAGSGVWTVPLRVSRCVGVVVPGWRGRVRLWIVACRSLAEVGNPVCAIGGLYLSGSDTHPLTVAYGCSTVGVGG